ncbi:MAG: twin-arginine translocase subunit TatC [Mycobacterium sp.]|nr:twin-arginine translocase subunit TatC [Mycobacterium sp.]
MSPTNTRARSLPGRLIMAGLCIAAGVVVGWFLARPTWDILWPNNSPSPAAAGRCKCTPLLDSAVMEFSAHLKLAFIAGLVLSAPGWLYQLFAIIAPRLRSDGRRSTFIALAAAITLFVIGSVLAWLTLREGLWMSGSDGVVGLITVGDYLNQAVARLLIFVAIVELPMFAAISILRRRNRPEPA